jgi:hypothetical protein
VRVGDGRLRGAPAHAGAGAGDALALGAAHLPTRADVRDRALLRVGGRGPEQRHQGANGSGKAGQRPRQTWTAHPLFSLIGRHAPAA